jgi:hypothetical protein
VSEYLVLTAASIKMAAFWDNAPCSLVETDTFQSLHHQDNTPDDGWSNHPRNVGLLLRDYAKRYPRRLSNWWSDRSTQKKNISGELCFLQHQYAVNPSYMKILWTHQQLCNYNTKCCVAAVAHGCHLCWRQIRERKLFSVTMIKAHCAMVTRPVWVWVRHWL